MGWLDGQVALVTGGGSGIGRAVVERFLAEGASVGVLERSSAKLSQLKEALGQNVVAVQGDASSFVDSRKAVEETVAAFDKLEIFVGNAGVFDHNQRLDTLDESQLEDAFDELFGVNVKGLVVGAKAVLPELRKSEGCMIFTASVASFNSGGGGVLYTASKHAVAGIIRQLAAELAPKVRVNGVAPGGTKTDLRGLEALGEGDLSQLSDPGYEDRLRSINPLGLVLQPDDIAGAYVLLASKRYANGITGTIITVDAGASLRLPRRT